MRTVLTIFACLAPLTGFLTAAAPVSASPCPAGFTITLHPGVPPSEPGPPRPVAPDLPQTPITLSLPLYPGATPLPHVLKVVQGFELTPYLQSGLAEYHTDAGEGTLKKWSIAALTGCGWRRTLGTMSTNAGIFTSGYDFVRVGNPLLTLQVSFGRDSSGGTDIAYGISDITYPPRPAGSYLHGPFTQLRLAFTVNSRTPTTLVSHVAHATIVNRVAITRVVRAVDSLTQYQSVRGACVGSGIPGPGVNTPVWLSFVRADGSVVHAYDLGAGACLGLAVNGYRWLIDDGRVSSLLLSLVTPSRGK